MSTDQQRHEPLTSVQYYLSEDVPGVISVAGIPAATLRIDPMNPSLAIRFPARGPEPDVTDYRNLHFESLIDGAELVHQLTVTLHQNEAEVYPWVCAILDRVQLESSTFAAAVDAALLSLDGILALRRGLTRSQQVGLFGELLVLLALAEETPPGSALDAWRGPLHEEHDFGIREWDLEVKTTEKERREHRISGPTQLTPTVGRTLYLVSVQVTEAPAESGLTLADLVAFVRAFFELDLDRLNRLLVKVGYRDADSSLYNMRWTLRSAPTSYEVTPQFPALTQRMLDSSVPSAERLTDVSYQVDVTGMVDVPNIVDFEGPTMGELFT